MCQSNRYFQLKVDGNPANISDLSLEGIQELLSKKQVVARRRLPGGSSAARIRIEDQKGFCRGYVVRSCGEVAPLTVVEFDIYSNNVEQKPVEVRSGSPLICVPVLEKELATFQGLR